MRAWLRSAKPRSRTGPCNQALVRSFPNAARTARSVDSREVNLREPAVSKHILNLNEKRGPAGEEPSRFAREMMYELLEPLDRHLFSKVMIDP